MTLTCSLCENNTALTIYRGNALCSACFVEVKKLLAQQEREYYKSFDIDSDRLKGQPTL